MPIGELCNREVVFATRKTKVVEAAQLMRQYHVGDLVVVDEIDGKRVPVGIVTDRDIVIEVVAKVCSAEDCMVENIMSAQLVSVDENEGVLATIRLMRTQAVRRIPVVGRDGGLVGIVSADDMLELLAEELTELARVAPREQGREVRNRIS
jgi:CBS domain-containing protein